MDKIHCTLHHSTDIGYRLSKTEKIQIEKAVTTNDEKIDSEYDSIFDDHYVDAQLLELKKIIISKQQLLQYVNNESFEKFNSKHDSYDFGQCYVYWDYFKKEENYDNLTWSYIHPKFSSMKNELINNRFCTLTKMQWINEYKKALCHKNSYKYKGVTATPEHNSVSYSTGNPLGNDAVLGITEGTPISEKHLLAIMLYCNYDLLSYEFSKTYRRLDKDDLTDEDWRKYHTVMGVGEDITLDTAFNHIWCHNKNPENKESDASIKGRHCKFYHWAKALNELVHRYCDVVWEQGFKPKMYHGISKKMKFSSFRDEICQPLSTTTCLEVALNFTDFNNGIVVEMASGTWSTYFDCQFLSDFAAEKELFFINIVGTMKFVNILDAQTGHIYDVHIKALRVIEAMSCGQPFEPDSSVWQKMIQQTNLIKRFDLKYCGAKPINTRVKLLTLQLIKHELNRYQPDKYQKRKGIDGYIEELLHYMCLRTECVFIDWTLMSVEMTDEKYCKGGYNGYLFLKQLFCIDKLGMIDLNMVC
eukprot:96779_1